MRAVRFCHVLGFEIDDYLAGSIRAHAPELARTAMERVASEMVLTFSDGRSAEACGSGGPRLLDAVLPEMAGADGWGATLALLARLDDMLARPLVWFPATADVLRARWSGRSTGVWGALSQSGWPAYYTAWRGRGRGGRPQAEALRGHDLASSDRVEVFLSSSVRRAGLEERGPASPPESRTLTREEVLFLWGAAPFEPEVILLAAAAGTDWVLPGPAGRMVALWAERSLRGVSRPPVDGGMLIASSDWRRPSGRQGAPRATAGLGDRGGDDCARVAGRGADALGLARRLLKNGAPAISRVPLRSDGEAPFSSGLPAAHADPRRKGKAPGYLRGPFCSRSWPSCPGGPAPGGCYSTMSSDICLADFLLSMTWSSASLTNATRKAPSPVNREAPSIS